MFLAMMTVGWISLPAASNEVVQQNSWQNSNINGNYNSSVQKSSQINRNGGYEETSEQGSGSYQGQRRINIPRGHYPPPGECKIWNPALPPGQQSPPISCSSLPDYVSDDGRIILYSDGTQELY